MHTIWKQRVQEAGQEPLEIQNGGLASIFCPSLSRSFRFPPTLKYWLLSAPPDSASYTYSASHTNVLGFCLSKHPQFPNCLTHPCVFLLFLMLLSLEHFFLLLFPRKTSFGSIRSHLWWTIIQQTFIASHHITIGRMYFLALRLSAVPYDLLWPMG